MDQAQTLAGRRIAVHVAGSIAAVKAGEVVTLLGKRGAAVRVAMTAGAQHFVTPLTFQSLSGHPVAASVWEAPAGDAEDFAGHGMEHLALSAWCELQVCVAATADLIARLALGLADDAVTTTALACRAPLLLAPAMETAMWEHAATQTNLATLRARGALLVGPVAGRLASGRSGLGRMAEPADIVAAVERALGGSGGEASPATAAEQQGWLAGEHVVVTSGGTREPIDPVRYIGNHSSGKMGLALAGEAVRLGARVTLVTTTTPATPPGVDVVPVTTAAEMLDAVQRAVADASVLIMAAAVADYRPAHVAERKIKKSDQPLHLDLVPTVDILRTLRALPRREGLFVVGFAAETHDLLASARHKLDEKGLDLIVANDVSAPGVGMGADDNAVTVIARGGVVAEVGRAPKPEVARAVFVAIHAQREARR